jgi:hypothetical protein
VRFKSIAAFDPQQPTMGAHGGLLRVGVVQEVAIAGPPQPTL